MKPGLVQRIVTAAAIVTAMLLLAVGLWRTHKVYDRKDAFAEFGLLTFTRLPDRNLVVDATFTGVQRTGDKLYSTYDRLAPRGKKACPT